MGQPHKHAEIIKAKADGKNIQERRVIGEWHDMEEDDWIFDDNFEYRIKPEPPKYPKYRGSPDMLSNAAGISWDSENDALMFFREGIDKAFFKVAHHAIEQSIHDGDVVPASMLEKVAIEVQKACRPTLIGAGGGGGNGSGTVYGSASYSQAMQVHVPNPDLAAIITRVKEGK